MPFRLSTRGLVAALAVLLVTAACVRLGLWQLDRLEQRRERNAALEQALRLPAVELTPATAAALLREPERWVNRRVQVSGVYDAAGEVVLRGRAHEGRPGVHLVTPLRIGSGDTAVLVNRGWAPSPDAATIDPLPLAEPGRRTVQGILQTVPTPDAQAHRAGAAPLVLRRLDLDLLRARTDGVLPPLYVQQLPTVPARSEPPLRVGVPPLDDGPHLGYAIQWFSFAAIALFGSLIVALYRARRSG